MKNKITEKIYDVGEVIVSHQKEEDKHRIVICIKPPQLCSEWVHKSRPATYGEFMADYDTGVVNGKLVME